MSRIPLSFVLIASVIALAGCASPAPSAGDIVGGGGSASVVDFWPVCDLPADDGQVSTKITAQEFADATGVTLAGTPDCIAHNGKSFGSIDAYTVGYASKDFELVKQLYANGAAGGWGPKVEPATSASGAYAQLDLNGGTFQIMMTPDLATDSPGLGMTGPAIRIAVSVPH